MSLPPEQIFVAILVFFANTDFLYIDVKCLLHSVISQLFHTEINGHIEGKKTSQIMQMKWLLEHPYNLNLIQ